MVSKRFEGLQAPKFQLGAAKTGYYSVLRASRRLNSN